MTAHDPTDDGGVPEHERAIGETGTVGDRIPRAVSRRARNGTLALLAGGLMLGRAARAIATSRGRAVVRAIAGTGLIVVGLRQRRSATAADRRHVAGETGREAPGATDVTISERSEDATGTAGTPGEAEPTGEGTSGGETDEGDVGMEGDESEDPGIDEQPDETGGETDEEDDPFGGERETDEEDDAQ